MSNPDPGHVSNHEDGVDYSGINWYAMPEPPTPEEEEASRARQEILSRDYRRLVNARSQPEHPEFRIIETEAERLERRSQMAAMDTTERAYQRRLQWYEHNRLTALSHNQILAHAARLRAAEAAEVARLAAPPAPIPIAPMQASRETEFLSDFEEESSSDEDEIPTRPGPAPNHDPQSSPRLTPLESSLDFALPNSPTARLAATATLLRPSSPFLLPPPNHPSPPPPPGPVRFRPFVIRQESTALFFTRFDFPPPPLPQTPLPTSAITGRESLLEAMYEWNEELAPENQREEQIQGDQVINWTEGRGLSGVEQLRFFLWIRRDGWQTAVVLNVRRGGWQIRVWEGDGSGVWVRDLGVGGDIDEDEVDFSAGFD